MPEETGSESRSTPPRSAEPPVPGVPGSPPVTPGPQIGVQGAEKLAAAVLALGSAIRPTIARHVAEQTAFEIAQTKIRMLCPPGQLRAVEWAIAVRAVALTKANGQASEPTVPQLTEASESVYSDLAAGWVPKP